MQSAIKVLIVEDEDGDALLVEKAFRKNWPEAIRTRAKDGAMGLELFHSEPASIVLLDLTMPNMDGFEVLRRLRTKDDMHKSLVVVLSGSESEEDIKNCYKYSASAYMAKPSTLEGYDEFILSLKNFWLNGGELKGSCLDIWFA